ncbi:hypothetical protein HBH70_127910 [Parastagonospora nodorum]|nr:hypothetical protein HBH53_181000 [Parastagonospora nodorum]KAH4080792.1 hypothetical protein HBH46_228110 [Parastagonospora nodorum]KAH4159776.1 hypothetical protein HBH43_184010 [Parastagonospora nodorum]KAH4187813.1 hypothetical protein HBH42_150370 [Parastagonospora nodorum]KAH4405780.1 hypothetical protein HBH92_179480 [Parastagonospora nodorum]
MATIDESRAKLVASIQDYDASILEINQADLLLHNVQRQLRRSVHALRHCNRRARNHLEQKTSQLVTTCITAEATFYRSIKRRKEAFKQYMANAAAYAKSQCISLCEMMYEKLPRELRDMVYSHILKNEVVWVGQPPLRPSRDARFTAQRAHRFITLNNPSVKPEPTNIYVGQGSRTHRHMFDVNFVTDPILCEFDRSWYSEATFVFDDPSHIPNFFATSELRSGLDVSTLVRKIIVRLPENVIRKEGYEIKRYRHNHRDYLRIITASDRCHDYPLLLASFLTTHLKPPVAITFHILPTIDIDRNLQISLRSLEVWDKHERSARVLLDGITYVWPLIEELEARGRKISICLDSAAELSMTKNHTLWSPEGCLARAIEWGLEKRNKATQTIS